METIIIILSVLLVFHHCHGYIKKIPGNIPGSYKYSNSTWACPIEADSTSFGDTEKVCYEIRRSIYFLQHI